MKKHLLLFSFPLLLLQACKKNNNDDNPPAGTRLVKETVNDGAGTQTATYGYAADGKLASIRWAYGGSGGAEETRITRNAAGLIESITITGGGSNTVVNVNSAAGKYTSAEWTESNGTPTQTRKISYVYSSDGHIAEATTVDYFGTVADPKTRLTYTYRNNNLVAVKVYRISGGTNNLSDQFDFEYDDKINPFAFGAEWIVLSLDNSNYDVRSSANNCTKVTVTEDNFPPETYNFTYTYTAQNRPATFAFKAAVSPQPATTGTYTYE